MQVTIIFQIDVTLFDFFWDIDEERKGFEFNRHTHNRDSQLHYVIQVLYVMKIKFSHPYHPFFCLGLEMRRMIEVWRLIGNQYKQKREGVQEWDEAKMKKLRWKN